MYRYLFWHYSKGIKSFLIIWRNFIEFFWNFFSIKLLFRTLFSHWRRDITRRGPGFDLKEFLEALIFNIFTRLIGAVVRSAIIFIGLLIELLTICLGIISFLVWLILPFVLLYLLLAGIIFIFSARFSRGLLMIGLAALLFFLPRLFYSISKKKMPSEASLEEMMKEPWFDLVWERAEIDPETGKDITLKNLPRVLKEKDLSEEEFEEIVFWVAFQYEKEERAKGFWLRENLITRPGIGKDWAYGYTLNLDRFCLDLGLPQARKFKSYLIGREKDIEIIERVLARAEENNILVVGEPGTGRKTVIRGFADFVYQGKVLPPLKHKRVLMLDIGAAIAGLSTSGEIENRLRLIFNEAVAAGNIILVIDEFHNFIGTQTGLGKIDISGVLMPYLSSKNIQLIGIVTYEGLHKNIEANPSLLKFFEKVEIKEPDEKNSLLILEDIVPRLEERIGIRVTYKALKEIVTKAIQYFADVPMPERAIDLLDESLLYVATKTSDKTLKVEHVDLILSEKTEIPIGKISQEEKEKLAKLEDVLHLRIINQEEAVKGVASAMRRARLGIGEKRKPIGSFLFLGPTGVGKTETAKALTEAYFGQEERMIRLDMSEYQNIYDLSRLIGTTKGEPGYLTTQIREDPFSLLLLDEIEKAHANILNLFYRSWMKVG